MQKAKVMQLFRLFAFLDDARPYEDLADAAMLRVTAMLKPDADPDDVRLCYYGRLLAAGTVTPTYAGSAAGTRADTEQCTLAERLAAAYRSAAAELLRDEGFVFAAISS